jgi:hypothetical protein
MAELRVGRCKLPVKFRSREQSRGCISQLPHTYKTTPFKSRVQSHAGKILKFFGYPNSLVSGGQPVL